MDLKALAAFFLSIPSWSISSTAKRFMMLCRMTSDQLTSGCLCIWDFASSLTLTLTTFIIGQYITCNT